MWTRFLDHEPDNNRELKIVLFGNGERRVFFSDGKFYKNKNQKDKGRELGYISKYQPFSTKENMATHWRYT
jgi:hypothetical protein